MAHDKRYGKLLINQYIYLHNKHNGVDRLATLFEALSKIIEEISDESGLQFFSLFSRIAYLGSANKLPQGLLYNLHHIRKNIDKWVKTQTDKSPLLLQCGVDLICSVYQINCEEDVEKMLPGRSVYEKSTAQEISHIAQAFAHICEKGEMPGTWLILPEAGEQNILMRLNVTGKNELFNSINELANVQFTLPLRISLWDIEVQADNSWIPAAVVVHPDYLMDVSAVSDASSNSDAGSLSYILKKFKPIPRSQAILIGNVAGYFLDELVHNPSLEFKNLISRLFRLYPLQFARMDDVELRTCIEKLQVHFASIQAMVLSGFASQGLDTKNASVEPSFYSTSAGLQGRLDLFFNQKKGMAVVELKSGKAKYVNKYGLSQSHYIQTLLYDLIVSSVFPSHKLTASYILYSAEYDNPLRFAPVLRTQQYEALSVRNALIALEWKLCELTDQSDVRYNLLSEIKPENYKGLIGFMLSDVLAFERVYQKLSSVEKRYFNAAVGMIAREHRLAKVGSAGREGQEGQAALWQKGIPEKESAFEILQYLQIEQNLSNQEEPLIILQRTPDSNPLANFRIGDIVVLYPIQDTNGPVQDQLIKCSIVGLNPHKVTVRLRARQSNPDYFNKYPYWNLEADWLDSSFLGSTRALFEWASCDPTRRQKILGTITPDFPLENTMAVDAADLTQEQMEVCSKIVASDDIMLLWGPPGTGKTSKVLHHVIRHLLENTSEKLLVMAYTNRAVDEICESIEAIQLNEASRYIRVGSRYGTAAPYQEKLLDNVAAKCQKRTELNAIFNQCRLVVGTVASIQGKSELFELMNFDRLLIDEASQIIEPAMAGLLSRFKKCLLIGDHLQLPAVIVQSSEHTQITHPELLELGFTNLKESLFERLLTQYQRKEWHHAIAILTHQGRMHEDIMQFPNFHFYGNKLKTLPTKDPNHFQKQKLSLQSAKAPITDLPSNLLSSRVVFIPVNSETNILQSKVNLKEAAIMCRLVQFFKAVYEPDSMPSIGIITPYRAQIATIKHMLEKENIDFTNLHIDTVERFQGGARDVILISLCVQNTSQFKQLISTGSGGVDRKLNVALTRARKHLVLVGNEQILKQSKTYLDFIEKYSAGD
jgi:DNA replication ATP-dependent helicase Dna2